MKILFLSWWWPYPANNGSKLRIYNLLAQLARQHQVTLLAFAAPGEATPDSLTALERFCAKIAAVPRREFSVHSRRALAGFLAPLPRSLVDTYSAEMAELARAEANTGAYHLVVASEMQMTRYALKLAGVPCLAEEIEVAVNREQFLKQTSWLKRARSGLTWLKLVHYLRRVRRAFDGCTVVSQVEADYLRRAAPEGAPLCIVPNGVDVAAYNGDFGSPEADTLIYPGAMTYRANYDAAAWFSGSILPLIVARRPNVRFKITGSTNGVDLSAFPQTPQVHFTGYLDDIRPEIARSWVCVVPLRQGGGTRLKILEAMALGTPVVSTSKGAEGLEVTPGHDILIADEPEAFAQAVLRLLENPSLRVSLAEAGRRLVQSRYDWQKVGDALLQFVAEIGA